jgi:hypothetical protein
MPSAYNTPTEHDAQAGTKKKESESVSSNLDGSLETTPDRQTKCEFEQQVKNKMTLRRSLISPPYSAPSFVFKRLKDFVTQVSASRCPKLPEEFGKDFHQMRPGVESLLTIGYVQKFEFRLQDTVIFVELLESFDKSAEDMSPPLVGILEPLDHVEPLLIVYLKEPSSSCASIIKISETLELKLVKLQFSEPEDNIQRALEEKT